ncbi:KH domain-containing protein, partial [Chloroflexota bacterium]
SIVNAPDDVVVTEEEGEQGIVLKLQVADDDKGRVIGKQGRIAEAMRTLIRVKAAKQDTRATLEIL